MAKSHDDFTDETDRKVREWHEKRAEEKRRPVGIMRIAGTPLPGGQPCREVLRLAVEYERCTVPKLDAGPVTRCFFDWARRLVDTR
jgi:hypothetical protein